MKFRPIAMKNQKSLAAVLARGSLAATTLTLASATFAAPAPAAAPDMAGMDHAAMPMKADTALRDPHAFSGGFTLETGPYALGAERQLRLADEKAFGSVLVDNLELVRSNGANAGAYDAVASFGRDYDKFVLKAEGEVAGGKLQEARTEALWAHAVAPFWDTQLGVRHDSGLGATRDWLAFGVRGLAPYWFEVDVTAYVGEQGRTALRLAAEYEVLLTQKWILQPRVEANLYGKADPARDIGKGLSDLTTGLRLRYEVSRQFAPYVGVEWANRFGDTADLARAAGEPVRQTRYVAGLRFWF
jgi:copper resistance protein B